jgi:outer membrane protein
MRIVRAFVIAAAIAGSAIGALSIGAATAQTGVSSPVLVVDLQRLRQGTPAGADMNNKLRALAEQQTTAFRTQNQAAATALQTEANALQAAAAGKTQAQVMADPVLKARIETQQRRGQDLQQKEELFNRSVQATSVRAEQQFLALIDPIITQIMTQRGATVVLDRSQIAKALPSVEITAEVETRFNAANPRSPQPVWVPVTLAPPEGGAQPKAATKK